MYNFTITNGRLEISKNLTYKSQHNNNDNLLRQLAANSAQTKKEKLKYQ
jgi:hypothetical protein